MRRCGARSRMRTRASGPKRAKVSRPSRRRWRRCRWSCSAWRCRRAARLDRGARFRQRHQPAQRVRDHRRAARDGAVDRRAGRPAGRRHGPHRGRAHLLPHRGGFVGPPGGGAGPAARDRAAIRSATLQRDDVIPELETLTTVWRGDETEVEALQLLARLYTEDGRYRDAFHVMRSAMAAHPDSEMTRRDPGRGGGDLRQPVPRRQGRRHAADRGARPVLRFPRADPDRAARRRDDPPARRPAGRGRSARPGRRTAAAPGRPPPARRRARAGGDPARRRSI